MHDESPDEYWARMEKEGKRCVTWANGFVYDQRVGRLLQQYKPGCEPLSLPSYRSRGYPSSY